MGAVPFYDSHYMESRLYYPDLIDELDKAFAGNVSAFPPRGHFTIPSNDKNEKDALLFMPAWNEGRDMGTKLVTVYPENEKFNHPVIQGIYVHFDKKYGTPLGMFDVRTLTNIRTAATSALASRYLSKQDSSTLLMMGTGHLIPYLVKAHASIRPVRKVFVWGRDSEKARQKVKEIQHGHLEVTNATDLQIAMSEADIISAATLSREPIVFGRFLKGGQHIDLVGSYTRDRREADDDTMSRGKIFVDTKEGAIKESGDITIPMASGIISMRDIAGDLFDLCGKKVKGRSNQHEVTIFKSVGYALEDLVAARYFLNIGKG
ncbi:MAG TPA: ornithine cyclodeaminase family protein [Saprospiraceae bacterium]|nr:ornithine cyclodeaminase family protein [Saprospiraceae bacterium]